MMTTDPYYERLRAAQAENATAAAALDAEHLARLAPQLTPDPDYAAPQVTVSDEIVPGPHGDVPVRVYVANGPAPEASRPMLVWCHGGGWIEGDLDMPEADATAREVCARTGGVVVSVDYRLATEGVYYPVPIDDVLAAWKWTLSRCATWGASASRAALGGASAGGNIAAGATLRLRDEGGPLPSSVTLIYPALHGDLPALSEDERNTVGISAEVEAIFRTGLVLMMENYLGAPLAEAPPYVVPAIADLTGMPPALIVVCEYDVLRVSGERFARSLETTGVQHKLVTGDGVGHAHINSPWLPQAQDTYDEMANWISNT
jgi:acetyl esterase